MNERLDTLAACHHCGLLQTLPEIPDGALNACARCDALLEQRARHTLPLSLTCAGTGLSLLALAFWLPVASVAMPGGRSAVSDLFSGPERLRQTGALALGIVVLLTLLVLPAFQLFATLAMGVSIWLGRVPLWVRRCFAALPVLAGWAMVDVFMLGATISLVRLRAWMHVEFGLAFFALGGVALCSVGLAVALDRRAWWERVPLNVSPSARSAVGAWASCAGCELVQHLGDGPCLRCGWALHARKPDSSRRTWALIITAALLAIPANLLPVMTIIKAGNGGPSTILGGTLELIENGFWFLALLVFVASILVPAFKLVALALLLVSTSRAYTGWLRPRTKLFRAVAFIGRWSMLDIFATMTLVALARFGWLGNVKPGTGATAFCAVVILTMLASEAFDPRLMWDAAGANPEHAARGQGR